MYSKLTILLLGIWLLPGCTGSLSTFNPAEIKASLSEDSLGLNSRSGLIRVTAFSDTGENRVLNASELMNLCRFQTDHPSLAAVENGKIIINTQIPISAAISIKVTVTLIKNLNGQILIKPLSYAFSFTLNNKIQEKVWIIYSERWGGESGASDKIYAAATDFTYSDSNSIPVSMHIQNADYLAYYNPATGPIRMWNMEVMSYDAAWKRLDTNEWYAQTNNPYHGVYCTKHESLNSNDHNYWMARYGSKNNWVNIDWSSYTTIHVALRMASGTFRPALGIEEDKQSIDGETPVAWGTVLADKDVNESWQVFEWSLQDFVENTQNKMTLTKINTINLQQISWAALTFYMDDMYVYNKVHKDFVPYPQ